MTDHSESRRPSVIAILGATATGKTDTAVRLALEYEGEVVSVDSRYLYRGLDIGAAKPTLDERQGVPHHLIDILDPEDDYSLALYQRDAYSAIDSVIERGRLPILAGGSPLYVNAVLDGWQIPEAPPDPEFRTEMEAFAREHGAEALHARLREIDPVVAERTPASNVRRVIRALEVYHRTGRPMGEIEGKEPPPYRILRVGLHIERDALYERINRRVERMLERGLVAEVERLLDAGISPDASAMRSIGYQEVVPYLRAEYGWDEMVERIQNATHRYVRHQLTWLRKTPDIRWVDVQEPDWYGEIRELVREFIQK